MGIQWYAPVGIRWYVSGVTGDVFQETVNAKVVRICVEKLRVKSNLLDSINRQTKLIKIHYIAALRSHHVNLV